MFILWSLEKIPAGFRTVLSQMPSKLVSLRGVVAGAETVV
jgi:hypothetical protein